MIYSFIPCIFQNDFIGWGIWIFTSLYIEIYLQKFIVELASKWSTDEAVVIAAQDAEELTKYFQVNAKTLLDKKVKIEKVNGVDTLFTIGPADGSYKVNFGEEELVNYFQAFLRPQLVEMLFGTK